MLGARLFDRSLRARALRLQHPRQTAKPFSACENASPVPRSVVWAPSPPCFRLAFQVVKSPKPRNIPKEPKALQGQNPEAPAPVPCATFRLHGRPLSPRPSRPPRWRAQG